MRQYSFINTAVVVSGVEITGWAEGDDVIDIQHAADAISSTVGAGGEMVTSISADRSGTIKFKLQQTSPSNKFLNDLLDAQRLGSASFAPIQIKFQDLGRNDVADGASCYIKKSAGIKRGAKANSQEWEFVAERLDLVYGDA
jgi:phage terminase large subunit-like protein